MINTYHFQQRLLLVKMADSSDLDRQIEQLKKCEIIKEAEVKALCAKAREILIEESNVQRVDSPVTVCYYKKKKEGKRMIIITIYKIYCLFSGMWRYSWTIL